MLNSIITGTVTMQSFIICLLAAAVLGVLAALVFTARSRHTGSLTLSLALLPPVVAMIIMLVNGNIGAGVAVAGTFALVRFRSAPGTAKEITGLFFSVALGLACGMGYIVAAFVFFVIMSLFLFVLERVGFVEHGGAERTLKISIPETLDYEGVFDEILDTYTQSYELMRVRTTNMGTLFELTYSVRMKNSAQSREFIDALRCRNGNLSVSLGRETDKDMM